MGPMRGLVVVMGTFGVMVGQESAVLVHVLPLGEIGFFAYVPAVGPGGFIPGTSFELNWLPSLWALPLLGLVLGLPATLVVHRLDWRLTRRANGQPSR